MDFENLGPYVGTWQLDAEVERQGTPWATAPELRGVAWSPHHVTVTSRWRALPDGPRESSLDVVPDSASEDEGGRTVRAWLDEESFSTSVTSEVGWTDEAGRTVGVRIESWTFLAPDRVSVVETRVDKDGAVGSIEAHYRRVEDFPSVERHASDYDAVAADYADEFADELARKPWDAERLLHLAAAIAPGPAADLGCGPGHVGAFLAARGVEVIGVDLSAGMVAEATRRHPTLRFVQGDLRELPFADGSLAGLTAFYSVIHLARAEVPRAFAEIARVLRSGGVGLVAVHHGAGTIGSDRWYDRPVTVRATLFGEAELRALAEGAGLDVVRCEIRPPYPFELPTRRLYLEVRRP